MQFVFFVDEIFFPKNKYFLVRLFFAQHNSAHHCRQKQQGRYLEGHQKLVEKGLP